jgi:FMN phosphatase YigB (HAD superfamily)
MVCGSHKAIRKRVLTKRKYAAIFDLDNTLVDTYGVYYNAKVNLAKKIRKLGGNIDDIENFVDKLFQIDRKLCLKFKTWNYNERLLVVEACNLANCQECDISELTERYKQEIKKTPKLLRNVKVTLKILKRKRVYLVLLSEGLEEQGKEILKKNGINKLFDCRLFVTEKEKSVYNLLINKLNNQGYAHIYCVGDSLKKDIALGSSVGAYTIWIPSKWEQDETEQGRCAKPTYKVKNIKEILRIIG